MAVRSDFNVIPINEHLGDSANDLNTDFPFMGNNGSIKSFPIEGDPVDDAYLLINHTDVHNSGHRIKVNNVDLAGVDMPDADGKSVTQMVLIPPGRLRRGTNSVQVIQAGGDDFIVFEVVVHWRERD